MNCAQLNVSCLKYFFIRLREIEFRKCLSYLYARRLGEKIIREDITHLIGYIHTSEIPQKYDIGPDFRISPEFGECRSFRFHHGIRDAFHVLCVFEKQLTIEINVTRHHTESLQRLKDDSKRRQWHIQSFSISGFHGTDNAVKQQCP